MKIASKFVFALAVVWVTTGCKRDRSGSIESSITGSSQPSAAARSSAVSDPQPELIQQVDSDTRIAVSHQQVSYQPGQVFDIGDGKAKDPAGASLEPTPLERDLLGKMRAINPRMNAIEIVAVAPIWSLEEHFHYLVMAYTTSPDAPFNDKFTNLAHAADMFGVFLVNREFTKAERRIGMFVSPRSGDFGAWFGRTTPDSVVICGRGGMYGDAASRWAFAINPAVSAKRRVDDSVLTAQLKTLRDSIAKNQSKVASEDEEDAGDSDPIPPMPDCPWLKAK